MVLIHQIVLLDASNISNFSVIDCEVVQYRDNQYWFKVFEVARVPLLFTVELLGITIFAVSCEGMK